MLLVPMSDIGTGTVLVVDDNPENRALAKATLEDEGFVVELANDGEQALARFAATPCECVLLDVRMPGMDGVTVCKRLRELPGGAGVPIVFVTAQRDVDTFDRARDAGGDDFITKPYRPSELVTRVGMSIKLGRMATERSELYEQIRRQRDDLLRLQLQKEQLIAFLVHDLKNPVNAIDLHAQRIVRDPSSNARANDAASKIQSETNALLRMILNLLDLSRADEGQLEPATELVSLDELFHDAMALLRPRAQAAEVDIVVDGSGLSTRADPELARRIVENLIDNAIRHAPEQSAIRISATRVDDMVEIRIVDRGAGIPEAMREQVFQRFTQGGESTRTGRGLGLAFCKLAVEAHGGRIWIEDGAPGAVFCLRLPSA